MFKRSKWIILVLAVTFAILVAGSASAADVESLEPMFLYDGIQAGDYVLFLSQDVALYGERLSEDEMQDIEGELAPAVAGAIWGGVSGLITSTLDYIHTNEPCNRSLSGYAKDALIGTVTGALSGAISAGSICPKAGAIVGSVVAQTTSWILDSILNR